MADRQRKGIIARWLEGKERSEEYARSTLPTNRFSLFWDILKGRFGRLVLINLLTLLFCLPFIAVIVWRSLAVSVQGTIGPFGSGLGVGYPATPNVTGLAEWSLLQTDIFFFGMMVIGAAIAAIGISGGMYVIRNLVWTEGVFVANDFWRGIKRNYLNVLEALLVFTVLLFVVQCMGNLADWLIAVGNGLAGWLVASKIIGYILLALSVPVCLWMISLGVNYKQGPWALFRNAIVMTFGTLLQTVVFAALTLWPLFLLLFTGGFLLGIGIIFLVLIGMSYMMLVWMDYSQWAFDRFINPNLGIATGRGLYNKDAKANSAAAKPAVANKDATDSAAMREYKRMIVAQGKSRLVSRPIKPIDDGVEVYHLPETFYSDDLKKLRESKEAMNEDVKNYENEHKDEERYVEYNRQFEEREQALKGEEGKKKKPPRPPKMLNKRK
ncbi:MAG: hypothetical protein K2L87_04370 [Clostridiales bacterium]|nr:hypothetical protein [Clostridiales bacterium]